MKEHRFSLPFTSFGREQCISPMKPFGLKQYSFRGGTYEFKNRATHREWDRHCPSVRTVCARSFFLSAVADGLGLWGPYGAKNVSWGDFAHFVEYTGAVMSLFPSSLTVSFAWAATVAETLFGILLIAGFKIRMASVLSCLLLLSFDICMDTGLGIKTPFDYSVFSAAAAAFLLAFWEPDRFTLDKLLNRLRN